MKKILMAATLGLGLMAGAGAAAAGVAVGVSIGDQGNHFSLAVGDYFGVPQDRVVVVRQRNIPDEELPVVFFIAQRARVTPEQVVEYRLRRHAWRDVARHFGLGPDVFYVELNRYDGPYGRPYANYRRYRRDQWRRVRLEDADVVNYVNLRFLSEHYKCAPDRIVEWRAGGRHFADMDRDLYRPAVRKEIRHERREDRRFDRRHDRREDRRDDRH